jgi:molecular chaperone GrpE
MPFCGLQFFKSGLSLHKGGELRVTQQQHRQTALEPDTVQTPDDQVKQPQSNEEDQAPESGTNAGNANTVSEQEGEPAGNPAEAESDNGETEKLIKELEEFRAKSEEHYQRYLRTQADFENFRRRTRQEKEELIKYASASLIEQLLPVYDNFERALAVSKEKGDFDSLLKGVDMIFRQFDQVLAQEGLKKIESVGKPFDPAYHQAIMQVESDEHEQGTVIEEIQSGYMLKEKVLRPAMVKVSS